MSPGAVRTGTARALVQGSDDAARRRGQQPAHAAGTRCDGHRPLRLRELGIDLADRRPRLLTRELAEQADVVVTMGCGDRCPYIPGKRYVDWDLPDPKGRPIDAVRATRDEIAARVQALVAELDAAG